MQREQLIQVWLTQTFQHDNFEIKYLAGDASFRRYARIHLDQKTYMLMDAPPEKEDCRPFVQIAAFLDQHGARVPHIVAQDLTQGFLLLEDFGDELLSNHLRHDSVDHFYLQAFKQIIQLQSISADSSLFPVYSAEKLTQEMRLFDQWMLPALAIELNDSEKQIVEHTYQWIVTQLSRQPQVIVHRDFHSRNLMLLKENENLGVIDFQDAVVGPDTYDLISLIRDAYVQWLPEQVDRWMNEFYQLLPEQAKHERSLSQFKLDADIMSVQRHLKILGIFVRLFERDRKSGYLKDLPRVMWYLRQELAKIYPLSAFYTLIEDKIYPKFEEKYGRYQPLLTQHHDASHINAVEQQA